MRMIRRRQKRHAARRPRSFFVSVDHDEPADDEEEVDAVPAREQEVTQKPGLHGDVHDEHRHGRECAGGMDGRETGVSSHLFRGAPDDRRARPFLVSSNIARLSEAMLIADMIMMSTLGS
jgi:hypothetical protein